MKKKFKQWLLSRRFKQAIRLMEKLDQGMESLNWPRWKRKQFWRDFSKSPEYRKQILSGLKNMWR